MNVLRLLQLLPITAIIREFWGPGFGRLATSFSFSLSLSILSVWDFLFLAFISFFSFVAIYCEEVYNIDTIRNRLKHRLLLASSLHCNSKFPSFSFSLFLRHFRLQDKKKWIRSRTTWNQPITATSAPQSIANSSCNGVRKTDTHHPSLFIHCNKQNHSWRRSINLPAIPPVAYEWKNRNIAKLKLLCKTQEGNLKDTYPKTFWSLLKGKKSGQCSFSICWLLSRKGWAECTLGW